MFWILCVYVAYAQRIFDAPTQAFYKEHHQKQTYGTAWNKTHRPLNYGTLGLSDVMHQLDHVLDESDPDFHSSQSMHAYQTAEAMRQAGEAEWLILTGFIHDAGKFLLIQGEPQWAVVGDTYPLGIPIGDIVFPEYAHSMIPSLGVETHDQCTECYPMLGIYCPRIGLDNVLFTYGHDEYLFQVIRNCSQCELPPEALFVLRYHSFYALHDAHDPTYHQLLSDQDAAFLPWLKLFSRYDLYSKPNLARVNKTYYQTLVDKFVPGLLQW